MKRFAILLTLVVAACAEQPRGPDRQAEIEAAMQSANATCKAVLADPRIDPIRPMVPDRLDQATFENVADNRKATPELMPALKVRANAFLQCQGAQREALMRTGAPAPYLTAHDMNVNRISGLYAGLVNGELTYGQYMRGAQESNTARRQAFQQIDAAMRAEGEREAMRRLQAFQVWQSMEPVTCFRNGSYTTCN